MRLLLAAVAVTLIAAAPAGAQTVAEVKGDGYFDSNATAVNNTGQVAGYALPIGGDPNRADSRGYRWEGGTTFVVLAPDTSCCMVPPNSTGLDINNAGSIVGSSSTFREGTDPGQPDRDCYESKAALWSSGGARTVFAGLGAPGFTAICPQDLSSTGSGINDAGVIVGSSRKQCTSGTTTFQAFRSSGTGTAAIGAECESGRAVDINNLGDVLSKVGSSYRSARIYGASQTTDIALEVGPHALNDRGTVVGIGTNGPTRYSAGTYATLAPLPGHTGAFVTAVANDDTAVGESFGGPNGTTATLWRPDGTAVDLNDLLGASAPFRLQTAADISDNGLYVVGDILTENVQLNGQRSYRLSLGGPPNLGLALSATQVEGTDLFSFGLSLSNAGKEPITDLKFPSGTGVVKDGPLGLTPVFAPIPPYPASIAAEATSNHGLVFEVTSPGTANLFVRVKGTNAAGGEEVVDAAVRIDAQNRAMAEYDYDAMVSGGLAVLFDQVARQREQAIARLSDSVRAQIKKANGPKGLLKADAQERALAHQLDVPVDTFAFLQKHSQFKPTPAAPGYAELALIFLDEGGTNFATKLGKTLDTVADKTLVTPGKFWRDMLFHPKDGEWARVGHELATMSREQVVKGTGYLGTAGSFWASPTKAKAELWSEIPKVVKETQTAIDAGIENAQLKAIKWDDLMERNPREGMKQFAIFFSDIEAAVAGNAVEEFFDPVERAKGLLDFLKAHKAAGKIGDDVDVGPVTRRAANADVHGPAPGAKVPGVPGAKVLAKNADVAKGPLPGLGNMTPEQLDYVSRELKRINDKFDVDIELQIRPVNGYSAKIAGGIGKVEAIPTKNLKPEDVLLGAPEAWLGQPAYYKPTLPKNFNKLPDYERKTIQLRYDEKLLEYKQFTGLADDPTGKAAKVKKMLKEGGADVQLGTAYKGKIQLVTQQKGGATLIQYKKLEVNGRPVFDPKGGPRAIVSDFDMNAAIDKRTGRHLPAGIRGQVELEIMNSMSKAQYQGLIPFGFHGWTHSGFDIKSTDFRHVAKHMLMYASDAQALIYARRWAPKFFPELGKIADPRKFEREYRKAVEKMLSGYERGKHLVKITAAEAVLGPGIDPNVGIPLP